MKKFLFLVPSGGICNRLRCIIGASKLANMQNRKLIIFWLMKPELNARFDSLFNTIPYKVFNFYPDSFKYRCFRKFIFSFFTPISITDKDLIKSNKRMDDKWIEEVENKNIFLHTCYSVIQDTDFSMFHITNNLKEKIKINLKEKPIGIHIRRTDNKQSILFSPTHLFLEKIENEITNNPKQKFFLATDDIEEENLIKTQYPNNILTYKKRSLDRNKPEGIEDAVIDLYILSQCKYILASYYSSFSDIASYWGNIQKIVMKENINTNITSVRLNFTKAKVGGHLPDFD